MNDPSLLTRYIYGKDPASQNDFFVIVIHGLQASTREIPKPLPRLRDIYKLNNTSFGKTIVSHKFIQIDQIKEIDGNTVVIEQHRLTVSKRMKEQFMRLIGRKGIIWFLFGQFSNNKLNLTDVGRLSVDVAAFSGWKTRSQSRTVLHKIKAPTKILLVTSREWAWELRLSLMKSWNSCRFPKWPWVYTKS